MAENIFENAKFGDRFKTRDGQCAVYWWHDKNDEYNMPHWVIFKDGGTTHYRDDGFYNNPYNGEESDLDIVGRWEEPIDEEKLEKLADDFYDKLIDEHTNMGDVDDYGTVNLWGSDVYDAYLAGYRKAKEE